MKHNGTTLKAYKPITRESLYDNNFLEDLTHNHEAYTHTISAEIGFDTATFTLKGDEDYLSDWLNNGLMRRITLQNPEGIVVWEGFVENMSLPYGSDQEKININDMVNRVYLRYKPITITGVTPTPDLATTLVVDDLDSQAIWGIKSTIIKGGEMTDESAFAWARTILTTQSIPKVTEEINTSASAVPALQINCKGYLHTLQWLPFISEISGDTWVHQIIKDVAIAFNTINAGWVSTDFSWMDFNFRKDRRASTELKSCLAIIKEVVLRGGLGGERWILMMMQDRRLIFKPAEDFKKLYGVTNLITRSRRDKKNRFYEEGLDTPIAPWDMLPDRILRTTDA